MSNFERPWSKLIQANANGVYLYATFIIDKWEIHANYRGIETDSLIINALAQTHIDALPNNVVNQIATLNTQQVLAIASERQNYYNSNPKKNMNLSGVPKDEKIRNILPL